MGYLFVTTKSYKFNFMKSIQELSNMDLIKFINVTILNWMYYVPKSHCHIFKTFTFNDMWEHHVNSVYKIKDNFIISNKKRLLDIIDPHKNLYMIELCDDNDIDIFELEKYGKVFETN